jgi:DNA-binding PadR family transcriptional regulator
MSTTRLLVLGAVRIFQPAHGYLVRRELASWQVDSWARLNPGSIYNALRTLTIDGLLELNTEPPPSASSRTAGRRTYRLTPDGESEFHRLTRDALWQLHPYEPDWLLAGLSFWWVLTRDEVLDALAARRSQIEARIKGLGYATADIRADRLKPDHVVEHFLVHEHQLAGELTWLDEVEARVRAGEYAFAGEPDAALMTLEGRDRRARPEPTETTWTAF